MFLLTAQTTIAFMHSIIFRMVLLLLPAVTVHATVLKVAAIAVSFSLLFGAPVAALLLARILVDVRLAAVVLPIMSVFALIAHVATHFIIEWAPNCLEMKHVEVIVLVHLVQQVD